MNTLEIMNKIKVLPAQEAQKIAAGEVVERPSSVVKEMIENSIDAGANQISLYIEKAGKDLIRVVDNGEGMSPDDAKICFVPHATSKITSLEDLEKIHTFGFRGEALATISAVSKVLLKTKHKNDKNDLGLKLELVDSKILNEEKTSCSFGTDFQIRELFYNTPVRKKFLKQDETEWNQILNVFNAFCLSNLEIHFKLFRDNKLIINAPYVEDIKSRVSQLWGHNFSQNLINLYVQQGPSTSFHRRQGYGGQVGRTEEVGSFLASSGNANKNNTKSVRPERSTVSARSRMGGISFTGLISNHNFWRYGRQQIFFFVNKRYVKNKELSKALLKGYLNVLPPARFPAAFIFLNLENCDVDVNVHPRKEEVKFSKPTTIEMHLQRLVKETLEENLSLMLTHSTSHRSDASLTPLPRLLCTGRANGDGDTNIFGSQDNDFVRDSNNSLNFSNSKKVTDNLSFSAHPECPSKLLAKSGVSKDENFSSNQSSPDYPIFNSEDFNQSSNLDKLENNKINFGAKENSFPSVEDASFPSAHPECFAQQNVSKGRPEEERSDISKDKSQTRSGKIIGQLLNTYILIEGEDGLIMIDQHAAHERILYEKFLNKFENKQGTRLLFPEIIKLQEDQIKIILSQQELFKNQGIEIDQISDAEIAIKASPPKIQNHSLKELVLEAIAFIEENENLEKDDFRKKLNEHVHSHMACKMAIKAGDKLTIEQMQKLIDDLQKTNNRFICVHGRPTTWSLGKYQIEKNFRRK